MLYCTAELFKYSGNSTDDQLIGTSSLNTWNSTHTIILAHACMHVQ